MENITKSQSSYINRELSWLEFNKRVLEEAKEQSNPLFERIKFLSITASNLDEFFMVRVAAHGDRLALGYTEIDPSGYTPIELTRKLYNSTRAMILEQYRIYNEEILPHLLKEGIRLISSSELTSEDKGYVERLFDKNIYPVLTPMAVDSGRPFPLIANKSLNIGVLVSHREKSEESIFATVQVPSVLERIIELPTNGGPRRFVLLEDIIIEYLPTLFRGRDILESYTYRVIRNSFFSYDEEGAEDLLKSMEESVKERKRGEVIKLEVSGAISQQSKDFLMDQLELELNEVFNINGPLDLTFMSKYISLEGYDHLANPALPPNIHSSFVEGDNIFDIISKEDILLHHPYQSFEPVTEFIRAAAKDPYVLAIKQTLYRVSGQSPIVAALAEAAENGKQVTVLVELKARFDEENNIHWAKRLEKSGCHVIYGLQGLKTHSKVALIVRKEKDGIKRYIHMSTGNYNDITAKFYTDLGLFTTNSYMGIDATNYFNMLSGFSEPSVWHKIDVAPLSLRNKFLQQIENEEKNASSGAKARIIFKMNSLVDEKIIDALYKASQVGVKIDLIVRGICCLRPGVVGLSENIRVISIVDRFLEHSRIYYFYNDGTEKIYLSSADLMPRNLDRRVEILFPVLSEENKEEVKWILDISLKDDVKAWELGPQGDYKRMKEGEGLRSQLFFYEKYKIKPKKKKINNFNPIHFV